MSCEYFLGASSGKSGEGERNEIAATLMYFFTPLGILTENGVSNNHFLPPPALGTNPLQWRPPNTKTFPKLH